MPDWPEQRSPQLLDRGLNIADNYNFASIIGGASDAFTKCPWVQVIAATNVDAEGFFLQLGNSNLNMWNGLLDIGVGPSGFETVLVPDFFVQPLGNDLLAEYLYFPLAIPKGTRISARLAPGAAAAGQVAGSIVPVAKVPGASRGYAKCIGLGVNTGTSRVTNIQFGNPATWTAIADPTPALESLIVVGCPNAGLAGGAALKGVYDFATGPSGGTVPDTWLIGGFPFRTNTAGYGSRFCSGAHPVNLPAGRKLYARAVSYSSGVTLSVAIYGFQ
jgi:hypothetical protein